MSKKYYMIAINEHDGWGYQTKTSTIYPSRQAAEDVIFHDYHNGILCEEDVLMGITPTDYKVVEATETDIEKYKTYIQKSTPDIIKALTRKFILGKIDKMEFRAEIEIASYDYAMAMMM